MIQQGLLTHVNLFSGQKSRHGNDHGKFLGVAFEIAGHGEDRAVLVAYDDHLRSLVEEPDVPLRNIEAAKWEGRLKQQHEAQRNAEPESPESFHNTLLDWVVLQLAQCRATDSAGLAEAGR